MSVDTYTITVNARGFEQTVINGVAVFQDQSLTVNARLQPQLVTLGRVPVTAERTNLVQPNVTSNTYNVTAQQMGTILNDPTHHTLYDVLAHAGC
jgi:hypothetical protein